jgi:hypothetical protein
MERMPACLTLDRCRIDVDGIDVNLLFYFFWGELCVSSLPTALNMALSFHVSFCPLGNRNRMMGCITTPLLFVCIVHVFPAP